MFQCLGLGTVETGGCGEDWWHPECLIGLPRDWYKTNGVAKKTDTIGGGDAANEKREEEDDETPLPPGFPSEDDFWHLICFKCVDSNPWLKRYAGTPGFLPPVYQDGGLKNHSVVVDEAPEEPEAHKEPEAQNEQKEQIEISKKRKAEDDEPSQEEPTAKRAKEEAPAQDSKPSELVTIEEESSTKPNQDTESLPAEAPKPKHTSLPPSAPIETFSIFLQEDFSNHLCRCAECFPKLAPFPQLREEEDTYEPPLSDDGEGNGAASTGTGSLLERGEAALSNVDRVRAIEGAMIYNQLRDKVKDFLKPFAESGQAVSAEDIKGYFEKLRGDDQGIQDAAGQAEAMGGGKGDDAGGDSRREQNGKFKA